MARSKSLTLGNIQGALLTWLSVERKFSYLKYNTCKFTLLPATLFFSSFLDFTLWAYLNLFFYYNAPITMMMMILQFNDDMYHFLCRWPSKKVRLHSSDDVLSSMTFNTFTPSEAKNKKFQKKSKFLFVKSWELVLKYSTVKEVRFIWMVTPKVRNDK